MLGFFRKHQRFFFVVVTIFVVISFSFFGTLSTFVDREEVKDEVIGKAVDGSSLYKREVEDLVRFLATTVQDAPLFNRGKVANLLNDDVIRRDILATGVGELLADKFFNELTPELEERLKKIKSFVAYAHPEAPALGAEMIWKQFVPDAYEKMRELREKCVVADRHFFAELHALALRERAFPVEMMRRLLVLQERQSGLRPDEGLVHANLHPFGFETYEDWFGQRYLELIAQFILNGAKIAEKNGYAVSRDEVRRELLQNASEGLKAIEPELQASYEQARNFFSHQLRHLGMEESRVIKLWQQVMLFRRLVGDVGNFALLDPLPFDAWGKFANEAVEIEAYELPEPLCLNDFRTLLKFQCYIEGTMGASPSQMEIPEKWLPIEEIQKRCPELVERVGELEWKAVRREDLAQRVTLKETWRWETDDAGWQELRAEFPSLVRGEGDRLALLDRLSSEDRLKIDRFARQKIVEAHPEWVGEAFEAAPSSKERLSLRTKRGRLPLSVDPAALFAAAQAKSSFEISSTGGETLYRVQVHSLADTAERLSFQKANQDGTLDELLDKRLEMAYPDLRKKHSAEFALGNGKWKPFRQVKDQVGAYLFAPLLAAIEEHFGKKEREPLSFYVAHRLLPWMEKQQKLFLANPQTLDSADPEWKLRKEIKLVRRGEKSPFNQKELFSLAEGSWSTVSSNETGRVGFFRLLGRKQDEEFASSEITKMKEQLAQEASRKFMAQLLDTMIEKQAMGARCRKTSS